MDSFSSSAAWSIRRFGKVTEKWKSRAADSQKRNMREVLRSAAIKSRGEVVTRRQVQRDLNGRHRLLEALGRHLARALTIDARGPEATEGAWR